MIVEDNPQTKEVVLSHDKNTPSGLPYLPWMHNTITFMRLDDNYYEAYTAQLSGCGVRVFRMYGETFFSHDNAKTIPAGCPDNNIFRQRFKDANFINNVNDLKVIAWVRPGIDVNIAPHSAVYQTHEPNPNTGVLNYVLRAAVSAIRYPDVGWCLAIQRSVQVYNGNNPWPGGQILVARKINGHPGYQLICETQNNVVRFDTDRYKYINYKIIGDEHGYRLTAFRFETIP